MKISTSSPYRENAIVNITRALVATDRLQKFYTTLFLAQWERTARRVPWLGNRLAGEFGRRGFSGIPAERVQSVSTASELMHVGARRLFSRRHPDWSAHWMYKTKARFDAAVSRSLKKHPAEVFVGMYAASRDSFDRAHRQGTLTVLNFVNSHPLAHNHYLSDLAGLNASHHELIPGWVTQRVEAELDLANLVLVPSRFVAQQLLDYGVVEEKIATIPYGVDLGAFYPAQDTRHRGLECLYVGQISYRKGIAVLLKAARKLQDLPVKFRLVGPMVSPDVLADLPENVVYEGANHPGGVADMMRDVDLFVLPSLEDACALVVLEAMASGLPVVTTLNNGSGELIQNDIDGCVVPAGDVEALGEAIHRLVESPELRRDLGQAARRKIQGAHSWVDYGKQVLEKIDARRQELGLSDNEHG